MKDIRTTIRETGLLLFDGGMGTYYASRNRTSHRDCEWANLTAPGEIEAIHRAYLDVGCNAIKTNTYGANRQNFAEKDCEAVVREGWLIARRAASDRAFVFADIGPIDARDDTDLLEEYYFIVKQFLTLGARHFLFETIGSELYLHEIAQYIKNADPEAFILVSFAAQPDGFTRDGRGRDYSRNLPLLGQKASHGCVRVSPFVSEDSPVNMYWLWLRLPYHTRVIILDD